MARVLKGSQFYLHTPRSSVNGMNHTCLCLPSRSWYSFTDSREMEGWVGLGESLLIVQTPSYSAEMPASEAVCVCVATDLATADYKAQWSAACNDRARQSTGAVFRWRHKEFFTTSLFCYVARVSEHHWEDEKGFWKFWLCHLCVYFFLHGFADIDWVLKFLLKCCNCRWTYCHVICRTSFFIDSCTYWLMVETLNWILIAVKLQQRRHSATMSVCTSRYRDSLLLSSSVLYLSLISLLFN